jgi:hypothetical protein
MYRGNTEAVKRGKNKKEKNMDRLKIEIRPFGDNEESTRVGIYDQLGESRIIPEELAHPDQPQVGDLYCVSPDQCGIVTQVFEQPDWLGFSRFAGVELDSQVSVDTRVAAKAAEPRVNYFRNYSKIPHFE